MSYTAPVNELRFGIRVHGRLDEILQLPHAEGLDAETVDAGLGGFACAGGVWRTGAAGGRVGGV